MPRQRKELGDIRLEPRGVGSPVHSGSHPIGRCGAQYLSPLKEVPQDQPEPQLFIQGLYDKGPDRSVVGVDVQGSEEEETAEA